MTGTCSPDGVSQSFTTGSFRTMRLQQLLAQLGYLPMAWTPQSGVTVSRADARGQLSAAYNPPAGSFGWRGSWPSTLKKQWKPGSANMLQVGGIRAFESVHGLTVDGTFPVYLRFYFSRMRGTNPDGPVA